MRDDVSTSPYFKLAACLVIDRSGSMASCRDTTVAAVAGFLTKLQGDPATREATLDVLIFDGQSIDKIRSGAVAILPMIEPAEFEPRGATPLYDAIGTGVGVLDARLAEGAECAHLVILTDGHENASREFDFERVKLLVAERQAKNWVVQFLAADLEVARQAHSIGMDARYVIACDFQDARRMSSAMDDIACNSISIACA